MQRLVLALVLFGCAPKAATTGYPVGPDGKILVPDDPNAPYPVDPGVKIGHLPNGMTYFLEHNQRPAKRAELRMVVKVGSVVEREEERGIAHFVEHMAFNGSERFPGQNAISDLEAFGARFGAHVNASTGFDETIYKLQVPTHDLRAVQTALQVFSDQASRLTFDAEECERERGVVLEEWRLDQGLSQRLQDVTFPLFYAGSQYEHRLPIGTGDNLMTFDCAVARSFWSRWYRPELMSVMVVGDVELDKVEAMILEEFGGLTTSADAPARPWFRVPDHAEPLVGIFADREITTPTVGIHDRVDVVEENRHGAYIQYFLQQLAWIALGERLTIEARRPGGPFLDAGAGESALGWERGLSTVAATPRAGRELEAVEALLTEIERIHRYGFTPGEIERARALVKLNMEQYVTEEETTDSATHVDEQIRVFLENEPMPGIRYEGAMAEKFLPRLTVDEVNAWAKAHLMVGPSRVFTMQLPAAEGVAAPSPEAVVSLAAKVAAAAITPPVAESAGGRLLATPPSPGSVAVVGVDKATGATQLRLSNGVRVWVKTTRNATDQVLFDAFSPGGTSLVPDADYASAMLAGDLLERSGYGELDAVSLARTLAGRDVAVGGYLSSEFEGLYGGSREADLETMFQLVHAAFVAPRFDDVEAGQLRDLRMDELRNRANNPDDTFEDRWSSMVWKGNPRYANWTADEVATLSAARAQAVWADRFADAEDFTFVIVGSATVEELKPLLATYVASLPTTPREETWKDDGVRQASGVVQEILRTQGLPRARVRLRFHGEIANTPENRNTLDGVAEVLGSVLRGQLRVDLGGTYGVGVSAHVDDLPVSTYDVEIEFACDPNRLQELVDALWNSLEFVRVFTPAREGVAIMARQRRADVESDLGDNGAWLRGMSAALQRAEPVATVVAQQALQDTLTGPALRDMATRVLRLDDYVMLVQAPEGVEFRFPER